MRARQSSFFTNPSFKYAPRTEHGGDTNKGRRKQARPLDPKRPLHVTLRSERARGDWSMLLSKNHRQRRIRELVERQARLHGIRLYQYANVGNHLHLLVSGKTRRSLQNFFRSISGLIARLVTGARKGIQVGRFWDELLYSRVVQWGRDFRGVQDYILINELEAEGVWSRHIKNPKKPATTRSPRSRL